MHTLGSCVSRADGGLWFPITCGHSSRPSQGLAYQNCNRLKEAGLCFTNANAAAKLPESWCSLVRECAHLPGEELPHWIPDAQEQNCQSGGFQYRVLSCAETSTVAISFNGANASVISELWLLMEGYVRKGEKREKKEQKGVKS